MNLNSGGFNRDILNLTISHILFSHEFANWHNKRRGGKENEIIFLSKSFSVVLITLLTNEARITSWLFKKSRVLVLLQLINVRGRMRSGLTNSRDTIEEFFVALFASLLRRSRRSTDVIVLWLCFRSLWVPCVELCQHHRTPNFNAVNCYLTCKSAQNKLLIEHSL